MSGLTTGKLPYPTGTDKVRDGDNAMQALAEAADNVTAWFARPNNDSVPPNTWGNVTGGGVVMPAGRYLVIAVCNWNTDAAEQSVTYTWLNAQMDGQQVGVSAPYVGGKNGGGWNTTTLMASLPHAGGIMSLSFQFGFAGNTVTAAAGSTITATRLGPL